jgi:hypothetical protein
LGYEAFDVVVVAAAAEVYVTESISEVEPEVLAVAFSVVNVAGGQVDGFDPVRPKIINEVGLRLKIL